MTWDLSKLYAGFDAPEFIADLDATRALADRLFDGIKSMDLTVENLEKAIEDLKEPHRSTSRKHQSEN